jgi:GNAT superfamily N-acetyltransferase
MHPWPREFAYRLEFLAHASTTSSVLAGIRDMLTDAHREHVLNLFSRPESVLLHRLQQQGYILAWSNVLLGRKLSAGDAEFEPGVDLRPTVAADVPHINALDPDETTSPLALQDPYLLDFVALDDSRIVAKAQVVTVAGHSAYVSDMFTAPSHRGRGHGSRLLHQLHATARSQGACEILLIPSRMTRQNGFYEPFGYRELSPLHVLIPEHGS